jgi:hypothetical protein
LDSDILKVRILLKKLFKDYNDYLIKNIFDYFFRGEEKMKKGTNKMKIIYCIGAVILLVVIVFLPLGLSDFILPQQGGGMVHCDPQMSDNIRLPVPTTNVGVVWYRNDLGGEKYGTIGIGIAGNGKIAASTFGYGFEMLGSNLHRNDNLIIYDYYGNHLWHSGYWNIIKPEHYWSLNPTAGSSTPAIDIHDRVIACDNQKIIMVNASNRSNIRVQWTTNYSLFDFTNGKFKTPISPTIVEDKTIVLPILNGPVYAFKVETGEKIGEIYLGENTTIDPYWGIPEMNLSNFWTFCTLILNDLIYNQTNFCPYHYNSSNHTIVWNCTVPYGLTPFNPQYFEGTIMFQADPHGLVTATETTNGTVMAQNYLLHPGIITGDGFFSTQNSACSQGNMVYVTTQFIKPGYRNDFTF